MYHGTVAEQNGLDIAIRALVLARRVVPELQLHIQAIGGDELPILKQLVVELGLSDCVVFTDASPVEKVVDFALCMATLGLFHIDLTVTSTLKEFMPLFSIARPPGWSVIDATHP